MDLRQQINALPKLKKSLSCLRREFDSLEYIESLTDFQFDISDNLILNYVDQIQCSFKLVL